uniref:RALF-like 2 protein n=1 Tax=Primula vulgaris TaxID=175104 RepID=A0A140GNA0_9ERIC|nr:RALF-like 2 protein [Primula vulgaris]
MAISKGELVLFLCTLVLCSHIVSCVEKPEKEIDYGDLNKGDHDRDTHHDYHRTPANPYRPGCELENKCRGGSNFEFKVPAKTPTVLPPRLISRKFHIKSFS